MKTCLYTTSYLNGSDAYGTDRLYRTLRYLFWYESIQRDLGFDHIHMVDDGSDQERLNILSQFNGLTIHRLQKAPRYNLDAHDYSWCWRGIYFMEEMIKSGYDKIITIDTDGFILNSALTKAVKDCNTGWVTWTPQQWHFPENALHILNKDAFDTYFKFVSNPLNTYIGKVMELTLPFTEVRKDFIFDRYGQVDIPQRTEMDFYAQANHRIKLTYERK